MLLLPFSFLQDSPFISFSLISFSSFSPFAYFSLFQVFKKNMQGAQCNGDLIKAGDASGFNEEKNHNTRVGGRM